MFFRKIRSLPSSNWSTHYTLFVYRPQLRCGKVMFLHLCVILFTVSVPACTTGHMTKGVSVWGVFVWGLCLGGSWSRESLSRGISWGSLSREVSLWGRSVREGDDPLRYRAGDTHPTGMHSCYWNCRFYKTDKATNYIIFLVTMNKWCT